MDKLKDFRSRDFFEQIGILQEIEESKQSEAVDDLFELFTSPLDDNAVDTMVRNCLRNLLLLHSDKVVAGLDSSNLAIRHFCVGVAGEKELAECAPQLLKLAQSEADPDILLFILTAMGRIRHESFLPVFQQHVDNPDDYISGLCIEMLGAYKDASSAPKLIDIVAANEDESRYHVCDVTTWKAIEALSDICSDQSIDSLVQSLHHKNPTARRIIHEVLTRAPADVVVPKLNQALRSVDVDQKILAANVLGFIGDKQGCDSLIELLEAKQTEHPNVRFAAYEALGRIPGMKSLVCLMDGLAAEADDMLLMSIVTALDHQVNPGVVARFKELLSGDKCDAVFRAIVAARALDIFGALYDDIAIIDEMVERIASSNSPEIIDAFWGRLNEINDERAKTYCNRLTLIGETAKIARLLAIDDSNAMLNFYRNAGAAMGMEVTTALNGKEAYDLLDQGLSFDVIVVDMNMPVMDGIEFTSKARGLSDYTSTPIIMATTESAKSQSQLAKQAGVSSFLKKPFTLETLQHKITKILDQRP